MSSYPLPMSMLFPRGINRNRKFYYNNIIQYFLFNSFVNFAMNCGPLSDITLSGKLCSFHILSQNNLASPSADVSSVVTTKYVIFDNLSHTTNIASFPATTGNFVMKSTMLRSMPLGNSMDMGKGYDDMIGCATYSLSQRLMQ